MPPTTLMPSPARHAIAYFSLLLAASWAAGQPAYAQSLATPATNAAMARLRVEPADGGYLVWADNRLAGPVEVLLGSPSAQTLHSDPALPARASVPAGGSTLLTRIGRPQASDHGNLDLHLRIVPGSSNARPRDVLYLPPLRTVSARIDQGFEGEFSHQDPENRYALDFATPIGSPVYAARAGTVMQVEAGFHAAAKPAPTDIGRANFIRILHEDGSMALYAHLATGGVLVQLGQQVEAGQRIGSSGNTGYSSAPHLHFSVQANRGLHLQSLRFRMTGVPSSAVGQH